MHTTSDGAGARSGAQRDERRCRSGVLCLAAASLLAVGAGCTEEPSNELDLGLFAELVESEGGFVAACNGIDDRCGASQQGSSGCETLRSLCRNLESICDVLFQMCASDTTSRACALTARYCPATGPGADSVDGTLVAHNDGSPDDDGDGAIDRADSGCANATGCQAVCGDGNHPPMISSWDPATPLTMEAGTSQRFEVWARDDDGDPLTYAWQLDGVATDDTSGSMTYRPTAAKGESHTIQVTVSDGKCGPASQTWAVTVAVSATLPEITTEPADKTVTVGQTATFSVVASGTEPLSYQWQKNGVPIGGATAATYATPATTAADNGTKFKVTVANSAGSTTSNEATLTVGNSTAHRVTIDAQKRTCIDGKPFFPIGIYSVPTNGLANARALGFNTVHTYYGEGTVDSDNAGSPQAMQSYLNAAGQLGLHVYMGLPRHQVVTGDTQRLEQRIKLLRANPALLVWYLFDEPYTQKVPASVVQASADLIAKDDPNHPAALVLSGLQERQSAYVQYVSIPDILMTDRYPYDWAGADLSKVSREIAVARQLVHNAKPIWTVVQMHGRGPGGAGYGLLEPTWTVLRNMTYQALASGAKGITYFTYHGSQFDLTKSPEGLKNAKRITGELATLAPVLLSNEPAPLPVVIGKTDGVLGRTFVYDGKTYVIVVNLKNSQPVTVTVSPAAGVTLPAEASVLFEDRVVKITGGKLTEPIEANGVRVYELQIAGL